MGSVIKGRRHSCCLACGIFPDQRLNPCPLHWQVNSYPLHHQRSPRKLFFCPQKDMNWFSAVPGSSDGKASAYNARDPGLIRVRKIPWRRKWHPTPIFWPGKSHGLRSLVGYSPWGPKELDMTERLHFYFPSGSVGKTPCFQCRGCGLDPWSRN